MKKILFDKTVHIVIDEEKRTVVAYVTNCELDAMLDIYKKSWFSKVLPTRMIPYAEMKPAKMQKTYRAVAKCHPEDTFDVNIGKKIAVSKLTSKYIAAREKAVDRYLKRQRNILSDFS